MKLNNFKKVDAIELSFENCEAIRIDAKDIINCTVEDITQNFYVHRTDKENKTLDYAMTVLIAKNIRLMLKANIKVTSNIEDEKFDLTKRLKGNDIISICFITKEKINYPEGAIVEHKSDEIYTDWDGNEYTNMNQSVSELSAKENVFAKEDAVVVSICDRQNKGLSHLK